jgi:O-antigen/teichoic acid export membrane protein
MATVRRGIFLSTAERYGLLVTNFATTLITARLLTPSDFGVVVLAMSALSLVDIFRDFGGGTYIVQADTITPQRVQTVFTISFLLSLPLFIFLFFFSHVLSSFYGSNELESYLQVSAICLLLTSFCAPVYALLRRDLAFGKIAILSLSTTLLNSVLTIALAIAGFRYMSYAWAQLASSIIYVVFCYVWGPRFPIYRLSFTDWKRITSFGIFDSGSYFLNHLADAAPTLAFGKTLGVENLGLYFRAITVSRLPERFVLSGFVPVLLPAFSKTAREGGDLKAAFLFAIEHLTVLLWPALAIVALLTRPLVEILVGHQWLATIPMIEVIAASYFFCFMMNLPNPILIAAGAVRDTVLISLLIVPVTVAIQVAASFIGLQAVAWSFLITNLYVAVVSLVVLRRRIPFGWGEMAYALRNSAIVTAMCAAAPLATVLSVGGAENVTIPQGLLAGCVAGLAWLIGIYVTRHPIFGEIERALSAIVHRMTRAGIFGLLPNAKPAAVEESRVSAASARRNINPSAGD